MSTDSKIESPKKSLTKTQIIDQVMSKWGIYIALLLLIILMAAVAPNFLSIKNGLNIAQKSSAAAGPGAAFAFPIFYASQVAAAGRFLRAQTRQSIFHQHVAPIRLRSNQT